MSYHWQDFTVSENIPKDAIEAGHAKDGSPIYIGRTMYENELQIVTFFAVEKKAYIAFMDKVIQVYEFQILLNYLSEFPPIWSKSGYGNLPKNAVECGYNVHKEPSYVARVVVDPIERMLPAKYFPAQNVCYYVNGTSEGKVNACDVLVSRTDGYDWIATTKNSIPQDYFVVSKDEQDRDVAVGYTYYEDERTLVKITPAAGKASIAMNGKEIALENEVIHVLVQHVKRKPFAWYHVVKGANYANKNVVQVGYTHDGRVLHLGRYLRDGVYIPGKVSRYDGKISIAVNGVEEIHNGEFDVLYLLTLKEI